MFFYREEKNGIKTVQTLSKIFISHKRKEKDEMRDSVKWGIASAIFTVIGLALNLKSKNEEKKETEQDKRDFNEIANRIEGGMR